MAWFVNGEIVDDALVRAEANRMRPVYLESVGPMDPIDAEIQLKEWARENVIEQMLLRSAAQEDPEPVPPEQADQQDFRVSRLVGRIQASARPPSSKEISEFYKRNKDRFTTPELIHVAHIVRNVDEQNDEGTARSAIESALSELEGGANFAEVADRISDCAGNGGDLGWFPRGQMVDEFDEVIFRLPVGGRSGIFRTPFGFHIARVHGRKPAGVRSLPEVQDHIAATLLTEAQRKALEDYLDKLREKAEIRQGRSQQ